MRTYTKPLFMVLLGFFGIVSLWAQTVKKHGSDDFRIAIGAYTVRMVDFDEALAFIQKLGIKYIQPKDYNNQIKTNSTPEQIAAFKERLAKYGIEAYSLGVFYMHKKEDVDRQFAFAKAFGVDLLLAAPDYELLPYVEQKVKETNIRLAIHTHGSTRMPYPDPEDVMKHIANMDPRIGICNDLAHSFRVGRNNVDDLKKYKDRIFDIHIRDVTMPDPNGRGCEMGRGTMDLPAMIRTLREIGYKGFITFEGDKDPENPFPGMAESIGYLRGVLDATARLDNNQ